MDAAAAGLTLQRANLKPSLEGACGIKYLPFRVRASPSRASRGCRDATIVVLMMSKWSGALFCTGTARVENTLGENYCLKRGIFI